MILVLFSWYMFLLFINIFKRNKNRLGAGGGSRNLISRVEVQHNKPLYDTRKFGQNQTRSVYRDLIVNKLPYQSVLRHYCEPGGSRTLNPKNFRLKKACLPISPQVHFVADYVGFEPTTYPLTAECSTTELIIHLIVELCVGIEPTSLDYKSSTSPFMLTEQFRVLLIRFT